MPDDRRLRRTVHWQDTVSMPEYSSAEMWRGRAEEIRRQVLFAAGLLPLPDKAPLNPRVTGRQDRDGYVVENVAIESFPGFYCTGNLYRPAVVPAGQRVPVVLTPHGHWRDGRFAQQPEGSVPARCISFAKQGYLVFAPDMVGYNDSRQVEHRDPAYNTGPAALMGIGPLGLQLWNNIRALDYLLSLPEADPSRVGVTGESGGATQTYLLAAVDDRPTVLAPVNMLSARYAGGCLCENAPGLRHDLTNMEIVAAAAPRPQLIVAATGDWTVNTPRVELPAVQGIYRLFDAEDRLECVQFEAPHNYNLDSRQAVYGFFARHLGGMGEPAPWSEATVFRHATFTPLAEPSGTTIDDTASLRVFPEESSKSTPADPSLLARSIRPGRTSPAPPARLSPATRPLIPTESASFEVFADTYRQPFLLALGAVAPEPSHVRLTHRQRFPVEGAAAEQMQLSTAQHGEQIPALFVRPESEGADDLPVLLIHSEGKHAWYGENDPSPLAAELLAAGRSVLAIDAFLTGAYLSPEGRAGRSTSETHFSTYNRVDAAWRVQDVLTGAAALCQLTGAAQLDIVAAGDAGLWAILARAVAPDLTRRLVADTDGFRWDGEEDYLSRLFVPHLLRLGGLTAAAALAAPRPLYLFNTAGHIPSALTQLYTALGQADSLVTEPGTILQTRD